MNKTLNMVQLPIQNLTESIVTLNFGTKHKAISVISARVYSQKPFSFRSTNN